jgi:hypothetical protein
VEGFGSDLGRGKGQEDRGEKDGADKVPELERRETTASPPVSPRVVAAILIIQKARVTSGTLLALSGMARAVSRLVEGRL